MEIISIVIFFIALYFMKRNRIAAIIGIIVFNIYFVWDLVITSSSPIEGLMYIILGNMLACYIAPVIYIRAFTSASTKDFSRVLSMLNNSKQSKASKRSGKSKISIGEKEILKDYMIEAGLSKKEAERCIETNQEEISKMIDNGLLDELEMDLEEDMYL